MVSGSTPVQRPIVTVGNDRVLVEGGDVVELEEDGKRVVVVAEAPTVSRVVVGWCEAAPGRPPPHAVSVVTVSRVITSNGVSLQSRALGLGVELTALLSFVGR